MALVQLPQPVEKLHRPLPDPSFAEVFKEQGSGSAVEVEEGFEDLEARQRLIKDASIFISISIKP